MSTARNYKIEISGLHVLNARIGVYERERALPQRLIVDITLNISRSDLCDELTSTINYSSVVRCIKNALESHHMNLLETACDAVAQAILGQFKPNDVLVKIHKPGASAEADVAVEVIRTMAQVPPLC